MKLSKPPLDVSASKPAARRGERRKVSAGDPVRRRRHWRWAIFVSVMSMLAGFTLVLPVYRSQLEQYLSIDAERFGLLFSLGPLFGIGVVLAGGGLVRRVGPTRVIRWCLLGTAGGMALMAGGGPNFILMLLGGLLCGALAVALVLAVSVYLTRLFPRDRRRVLALNMAIICGGSMVFPLVAEWLLALAGRPGGMGFGVALRLPLAAVAVALAVGALAFKGRPRRDAPRRLKPTRMALPFFIPLPILWLGCLLAIHVAVDTAIYTWMSKFLTGPSFLTTLAAPGVVLALYSLSNLVARTALTLTPEGWGRRRLMVLPGLVGGSILLAAIFSRSSLLTAVGYIIGGLCWSSEYPVMLAAVSRRARNQFGEAMAVIQLLSALLMSGLLYAVGWLANRRGEEMMWQTMAGLACGFMLIGGGGGAWLLFWNEKTGVIHELPEGSSTSPTGNGSL